MTPQSLPELETPAFRRALAAALGLPLEDAPRLAAQRAVVAPLPPAQAATADAKRAA